MNVRKSMMMKIAHLPKIIGLVQTGGEIYET